VECADTKFNQRGVCSKFMLPSFFHLDGTPVLFTALFYSKNCWQQGLLLTKIDIYKALIAFFSIESNSKMDIFKTMLRKTRWTSGVDCGSFLRVIVDEKCDFINNF
jgi:hypothetical protein